MKKLGLGLLLLGAVWMTSCGDSGSDKTDASDRAGEPCDEKTFEQTCEGNDLIVCLKDRINVVNCSVTCASFAQPMQAESCDEEDEDCTSNNQENLTTAGCFSDEKKCSVENDVLVQCEKSAAGITNLRSYRCEKATDGLLFYRYVSSEKCHDGYGVCSSDGKCLEPVACEDGYETHCDGNILKTCNKNRLRTSDCESYSKPRVCSVLNETPQCLNPEKECSNEGEEIVTSCNASTGKESLSVCTRAENGKLYYHPEGSRLCLSGCNAEATACKPASCTNVGETQEKCRIQGISITYVDTYTCTEKDGAKVFTLTSSDKCDDGHGTCSDSGQCIPAEDCDTKSFTSKCENGIAVNCTAKKVRYNHCNLSTSSTICAVVNDKASCYSNSDICSTEGEEIVSLCNAKTNKESLKKCTQGSDGNLYYVSNGTRECPNGCNSEGTKCAE